MVCTHSSEQTSFPRLVLFSAYELWSAKWCARDRHHALCVGAVIHRSARSQGLASHGSRSQEISQAVNSHRIVTLASRLEPLSRRWSRCSPSPTDSLPNDE